MSPFRLPRCIAVAFAVAVAGACLSLPAFAESTITVTFQPNNPWTQEIGSIDEMHLSHDYSVAVAAGKTLQINLVTRNPNVFFSVKNEATRKELVDTLKTGATTWSTENAAAATYLIHVYVQEDVLQRGEVPQYALQVGQYGQEDMQPALTKVAFQDGNPWAQMLGSVNSSATSQDYEVAIAAGDTFRVNLVAHDPNLHFTVKDEADGKQLVDTKDPAATTWSMPVTAPATFRIRVYIDPAAVPPGQAAQYALQIGHYPTQATVPAGAGSTAEPAPASALTAAAPASSGL